MRYDVHCTLADIRKGKSNRHQALHAAQLAVCHDCGAKEGEFHDPGCDMEQCPFCSGQLISCDCANVHFYPGFVSAKYDRENNKFIHAKPFCGLPKKVYEFGLSAEQETEWDRLIAEKGCVPFVRFPFMCQRCGVKRPDIFMVPDEEWEKYIPAGDRDKILCKSCFCTIADAVDSAAERRKV